MYEGFRRYHRYPVFIQAMVIIRNTRNPKHFVTQVNNISQGGMGVYTDTPLEMDTPVAIELSLTFQDTGREDALEGTVASLSEQANEYFMGICFHEPLTHEHLMKIMQWD